jgi:hypothetical protein
MKAALAQKKGRVLQIFVSSLLCSIVVSFTSAGAES